MDSLKKEGFEITYLPVYSNGIVKVEDVANAIRPDTALVTIMYANNEIGTIQPIAEIGELCKQRVSSSTQTQYRLSATSTST